MKITKIITLPVAIFTILFVTMTTKAAEIEATSSIQKQIDEELTEKKEQAKNQIGVKKTEIQNKKIELQREMEEKIKNMTKIKVARTFDKLNAMLDRLDILGKRLESRILEMESNGSDMTDIKKSLTEAKEKISQARSSLATFTPAIEESLSGENTKEAMVKTKEIVGSVMEKIRAAHKALVETTTKIKASTPKIPEAQNQ